MPQNTVYLPYHHVSLHRNSNMHLFLIPNFIIYQTESSLFEDNVQ